jgi:outer membrane protein TolC
MIVLACNAVATGRAWGQDSLDLRSFLALVQAHHPLYQAAELEVEMAAGKLRAARGQFDPKLAWARYEKEYKGSTYYDYHQLELKVPIYSGIEVKAGYELNTGQYLNPESGTPLGGLYYTEISLPLLRNLLIDQARAEVKMQQAMLRQSTHEFQLARNDLSYLISVAYWEFKAAWDLRLLYQEAVEIAADRQYFVVRSYELGKYAAIDTVESYMEWQRRHSLLAQAEASLHLVRNALSNQFWMSDSLSQVTFWPSTQPLMPIDSLRLLAWRLEVDRHPLIQVMDEKIAIASIDKTLQRQGLLPQFDIRYKPLATNTVGYNFSSSSATWGAWLSMPLFLRKETGKLQVATTKLEQLEWERNFKVQALANDINAYAQAVEYLSDALKRQRNNVDAARRMLEAERRKLELGSTTIFMINYRERYLYESQEKLIKTFKEYQKAQAAYVHKFGLDASQL